MPAIKNKIILLFITITISSFSFAQKQKTLWQPFRITPRELSHQHIDLSGNWNISYMDNHVSSVNELKDKKDVFETTVPNSVQWSYYKAGKLPHPYANKNSELYGWMDEKVWYYEKEIKIPIEARGNSLMLCFDGLDYFSRVWVNDSLAGVHEGMFGGPDINISQLVRYGENNSIIVEVKAGDWGNKQNYNPRSSGRIIKPWYISGGSGIKPFFSMGMWQEPRIEILPEYHLERPYLITEKATKEEAVLHLSMELLAGVTSLDKQLHPKNNAQMHHPDEKGTLFQTIVKEKLNVSVEFISEGTTILNKIYTPVIYNGVNWLEEEIVLPNPHLWYPNGMGEPYLYQVKITLKEDGKVVDQIGFDYGIRTIERISTAGPRTADRWENWQFVVNGEKLFVKGMNWMPVDVLLDLSEENYQWALEAAKNMGVQLVRGWGGGLLETDTFYKLCDELGIMVWQDFPIGNQDTPDYPQDIWEAQVVRNIFRLRNHPSLAVWCGGNEFNPYSFGNTASVGIVERNLDIFDKSRLFVRTTPDDGSMHTYPDMDPCWYNRSYQFEPWISETGIHSMPEANLFYELVDEKEFVDLGKMWDSNFSKNHDEFIHHFAEYSPGRVPRMLSRASHINDMSDPSIETITEATQVGAGEFYQVLSEKMQGNYPVTSGLMTWVFKRPWPVVGIQMMDWFGQAAAPYYFLKRTYEPIHAALDLNRLIWAPGEKIALKSKITYATEKALTGIISVTVYDDNFEIQKIQKKDINLAPGLHVVQTDFEEYEVASSCTNRYLFLVTELRNREGKLISRSIYYPRVLKKMQDSAFYNKYIEEPVPWPAFDKGPWLKPTVAESQTKLELKLVSNEAVLSTRTQIILNITNRGKIPAFMVNLDILGIKRCFFATDNYFWLAPGESKNIMVNVHWRESMENKDIELSVQSWNSKKQIIELYEKR